ncbi:MAG TPA: hypothetical protein VKS79_12655 [Gemmataceae bacterium]|nr:hypothetical protein [Gemmataceae bacterium]
MNLTPEFWYALATGAATLLVSAAHVRGYKLPVIEQLLDLLHGTSPNNPHSVPPMPPVLPAPANAQPLTLASILEEIRKRLPHPDDAKNAPPQVVPQADGSFVVKLPGK